MKFIYVLSGWKGFAIDFRVLPDAIHRRNGLKVLPGNINSVIHQSSSMKYLFIF